eukprot:PhM_4_TR10480/c2_g1_i1/m.36548/K17914/KIF13; kinesin family member 13
MSKHDDLCDQEDESVRVYVRVRPFNSTELQLSGNERLRSIVWPKGPRVGLLNHNDNYVEMDAMTFDGVFWSVPESQQANKHMEFATQQTVFDACGDPALVNLFNGYNSCIFAYGQTGSGKTHTMMGYGEDPGLIPRICHELFDRVVAEQAKYPDRKFEVVVNFFEIYNEKVKDLFAKQADDFKGLKVRNHPIKGPFVEGLEAKVVKSAPECLKLIDKGSLNRTTKQTGMNDTSSRSHAIFKLEFSQSETEYDEDGAPVPLNRSAQLNLVDLAGSERIKKSKVDAEKLIEATNINSSLTTLRKVIDALIDIAKGKKAVPPYRESMLTWVLADSLGGNSRTIMVAAVSPHSNNQEETLSTLRYALRAKAIVNKVRANESKSSKRLREMKEEMEKMQALVEAGGGASAEEIQQKMREEQREIDAQIHEIAKRQEDVEAKREEMQRKLETMKIQEETLQREQEQVQREVLAAEQSFSAQLQRNFAAAFRNAYQIKITKSQYEAEVARCTAKENEYSAQYKANEEVASVTRRTREELRNSLQVLRKEIKQQEFRLHQVTEQEAGYQERLAAVEAEVRTVETKLDQHNEESKNSIDRLEASVKSAMHEREVATELLNKAQAQQRRMKQEFDLELMNKSSRFDIREKELQAHVDGLKEQQSRLDRTVQELSETSSNYEHQISTMVAASDSQEKELESARNELRHRRIQDQREFRDLVQEMEIERETHVEFLAEGRTLMDRVHELEAPLMKCQSGALYRTGPAGVKAWLTALCLEMYYEAIRGLGVETLQHIPELTEPMLVKIRMLPGHRRKLLAAAAELDEALQDDVSIVDEPTNIGNVLRELYTWYEGLSFGVNGGAGAKHANTAATTIGRMSVLAQKSSKHEDPMSTTGMFGQQLGEDGLWHTPTRSSPNGEGVVVSGSRGAQSNGAVHNAGSAQRRRQHEVLETLRAMETLDRLPTD